MMSVEIEHIEYSEMISDWKMLNDIYQGEKAIKKAGTKYLPMLGGQEEDEYNSYKDRGSFYNALARTIQGLKGFIFRKKIDYHLPPVVEGLLPSIMSTGQSFNDLCQTVANSILKYGRVGLLVDSVNDGDPYIAIYQPETITNWRSEFVNGEERLTMVVLKEKVITAVDEEGFELIDEVRYRVLQIVKVGEEDDEEEGIVQVSVWEKKKVIAAEGAREKYIKTSEFYPKLKNEFQNKIQFYFIGSEANTAKINKPPYIDMAYINIDHWRLSVDYRHGLHFCSLPTPWAAGFDDDSDLSIGPVRAWKSNDPNASCGYLEFTGRGLSAVKDAIDKDEESMAILGARMIENTRSRVETAEAARIRQSGEGGALNSIVENISSGLVECFRGVCLWLGVEFGDSYIKLNTDFIDDKMTPQEITALVQAHQSGSISLDTFLYNLNKGEMLPPDTDIETEKELIDMENNKSFTGDPGLEEDDDDDDEEDSEKEKEKEDNEQ